VIGKATTSSTYTAIGVYGTAGTTSGSPVRIGGMFTLRGSSDNLGSLETMALVADNGATGSTIFEARDDGVVAMRVSGGGQTQIYGSGLYVGDAAPTAYGSTSPAQLTGDQNNYDIGSGTFFRLSSDASRNITGLANGVDGRVIFIVNVGSNNIVIQHNNAGSSDGNKILSGTGADITLAGNDSIQLIYDGISSRWRVLSIVQ
jgi:hypothetical protein